MRRKRNRKMPNRSEFPVPCPREHARMLGAMVGLDSERFESSIDELIAAGLIFEIRDERGRVAYLPTDMRRPTWLG